MRFSLIISRIMPYKMDPLTSGFKYLGYFLKPLGCKSNDWVWLLQKFKKRISHLYYNFLSLGGRLVLVQAVLSSLPVYWFGLAPIPISVLNKLRSLTFAFLWGSTAAKRRYDLVSSDILSRPKDFGGRGILYFPWFSIALRAKNFWLVLHNNGLWHRVLISKYLKQYSIASWLRVKNFSTQQVSVFWKGFIHTLPWIGKHLAWHVGNGKDILLGIDPIIGTQPYPELSSDFRDYLDDMGIAYLLMLTTPCLENTPTGILLKI